MRILLMYRFTFVLVWKDIKFILAAYKKIVTCYLFLNIFSEVLILPKPIKTFLQYGFVYSLIFKFNTSKAQKWEGPGWLEC